MKWGTFEPGNPEDVDWAQWLKGFAVAAEHNFAELEKKPFPTSICMECDHIVRTKPEANEHWAAHQNEKLQKENKLALAVPPLHYWLRGSVAVCACGFQPETQEQFDAHQQIVGM